MTRKDFKLIAEIVTDVSDPWARALAINRASHRLGQAFPRFDASRFQDFVRTLEASKWDGVHAKGER
jgi:hypothetical protein